MDQHKATAGPSLCGSPVEAQQCIYSRSNCEEYLFTTFPGRPANHAATLLSAVDIKRPLASRVAHAMCGVTMQCFARRRGFDFGGGSVESTSSAAPAIVPALSASARSSSTIRLPRE